MAGMRDIAKLAGVSLSTVSVVFGDGGKFVSDETRDQVLAAAASLNYQLPPKKHHSDKVVAVLLPMITSTFFSNLLSGIQETLTEKNQTLLLGSSDFDFEKEKQFLHAIRKQNLSGIILDSVCVKEKATSFYQQLREDFTSKGIPVVFLENEIEEVDFHCVYVDQRDMAYQSTCHLLKAGHRTIAHITGKPYFPETEARLEGYKQALASHEIPFHAELVMEGDYTPVSGYIGMKKLLDRRSDLTSVFCANDQMAIGAMKAVLATGKRIPEDIAVTGIDNLPISTVVTPPLTTIHVPTHQMGRIAAKLILESAGNGKSAKEKLSCNLIVRKSTDPFAGSEWELVGW